MPSLTPVDDNFFQTAPQRFVRSWTIDRPASAVWSELTGDTPLDWLPGLKLRWTSPRPLGAGATRSLDMFGRIKGEEFFYKWDEGRAFAFYVRELNVAAARSFAEHYEVEPLGDGRCVFTWKIAIDPVPAARLGGPIVRTVVAKIFAETGRHFGV